MTRSFGRDLTEGSIGRHLLAMAWPMLIGNILNTGYSIVNTVWLGKSVGKEAVGAVAVSFPVIFILVAVASGGTMATSILVSQFFGAKNDDRVRETVRTSLTFSFLLGLALMGVGLVIAEPILKLMNTPKEILPMGASYLRISLLSFPIIYLSFLVTSILRGVGDTKTPLLFMAAGVIVNAILDPFLILGIGPFPRMGLEGAAWASVFSSAVALGSGIIYLNRKGHVLAINHRSWGWNGRVVRDIVRLGFPSMVQQSLISIGGAMITTFVNGFGPDAVSAFGAGTRVDSVAFMPAMSIGLAVSALTGQNIGANRHDRVGEIFRWGILLTSAVTLSISLVVLAIPRLVMQAFVNEPEVIELGVTYLRIVGAGYIFFAIMFVANGIINGAGQTLVTMVFTLVSLWIVRVPLAAVLSGTSLGINGIWISMIASFLVTMVVSLAYYRSGRWRKAMRLAGHKAVKPDSEAQERVPLREMP